MMPRGFKALETVRLLAVLCLVSGVPSRAQENAPTVLQFQRIAIPEGRIDEVGGELLPVDRDKFQKSIAELNAKYRTLYGLAKPNIVQARYSAKFENGQLVDGSAELDIKHPHSEPAYLSLSPLGLAVDSFHWKGRAASNAEAGLLPTANIGVLVSQSDTLSFRWSLRGTSGTQQQEHRFRLSLPQATSNELLLDLPQDSTVICADGLVSQSRDPVALNPSGAAMSRWRIELGAIHEIQLRIVPTRDVADRQRLVLARPTYDYAIGTTGVELHATYRLDVQRHPLPQLTLRVDPGLRLATVQLDGEPISFAPVGDEAAAQELIAIDPPTPLVGGPHELKVTAYAPILIDRPWQLPRMQLVGVLWRQGSASLDVIEPLRIAQLNWRDSSLRDVEPLPSPTSGESRQFDLLSPEAVCELMLTRQEPRLRAQTGTTITLNDSIVASQFMARLSASGGAVFSIPLSRDAGWIVDSIETDPPQIDRIEVLPGSRGLTREIILREPVTPATPLRLVVKAHRRWPSPGMLTGREMRPFSLSEGISKSRLTAVHAELPLQFDIFGDAGLTRVTGLSSSDQELVTVDGAPLVFRDGPSADPLRVVLRSQPPRYSGTITAEVLVGSTTIQQSFLFRCEPLSTRVGSLRIRFSPTAGDAVQWSVIGDVAGSLTATRLDKDSNEWEVRLRRPRSVPFEIRATLARGSTTASTSPAEERETIVLASLPDAETQVGTVNIGTPDGSNFRLHSEGLRAIPAPAVDAARLPTRRATYRYAPAQDVMLQLSRHTNQLDSSDAWIWDAALASRLDASGEVTHQMLLRIENIGGSHVTVEFPGNVGLDRIEVNGESVAVARNTASQRIPLPTGERFPVVHLEYSQKGAPLGTHYRGEFVMPNFDLRCLNCSWRVWIPPGYESATSVDSREFASNPLQRSNGSDWQRRLFGFPIVRRTGGPWNLASLWNGPDRADRLSRQDQTAQYAQGFLRAVDSQLEADRKTGQATITWRTVIARSAAMMPGGPELVPLYIDRVAMADAGISPISSVPSRATSGATALRLSDLVFVGGEDSIVLTTLAAQAAGVYGQCSVVGDRTFVAGAKGLEGSARLVPAEAWNGDSLTTLRPWDDGDGHPLFSPLVGWTNISLQPSPGKRTAIVLYKSAMVRTFGWAALFVAVGCGIWIGRRSPVGLLTAVVAAIVVALLVPDGFVFISRSVLLGLLACVALVCLRRRITRRTTPGQSEDSLSFRVVRGAESVTAGLLLAAVLLAIATGPRALAQERPPAGNRPAPALFRVYDPVDNEGQPAGTHIYVSRTFFDTMETLKMTLGARRLGAILTDANYSLAVPDAPMAAMLPELQAEFELISLSAGTTTIRLPFHRDEVQLLEATFDGQRIYPRWSADGDALEIDAETLDRHQLGLVVRPVLTPGTEGIGFDLRIPTIPNSHLSITGRDAAVIETPSSLGSITRTDDAVQANLGPAERLTVHWPKTNVRTASPAEFTASQLIWVQVESQVIAIDTQFVLSVSSGALSEIELLVDPRLHLLKTDKQTRVTETLTPDNTLRRIRLQFGRAYEANESVTVRASFVMTVPRDQASVPGPLIQVDSEIIQNPILALSASPGIAASLMHEGDWPAVRPQDFAETWGTMQVPAEAIQLPTNESEWSLAVAPVAARLTNVDTTELRIGRQQTEVAYDSQVQINDAAVWQLELSIPTAMAIESVQVVQDDADLVRRFANGTDGTTTIFLTEPIEGDVRIALAGSFPVPPRGQFSYTGIRLADSVTSHRRLTVLRRADVLVETLSNGLRDAAATDATPAPANSRERVVGIYDLPIGADLATPDITLGVAPNPARFSGRLVTRLRSEDSQWSVTAELSLQVAQGAVDAVRIRLPRELTGSLRLDPPLPFEIRDVPGQSEPNVIILPPAAIDKEFQLVLDAGLQASPDGGISAPAIEVLDSGQIDRFLVLPKRTAEQEIEWEIRGLEQPQSDELQTTYRVRGRRMRAVVREVNQSVGSPQLLLADIEVGWRPDARYIGVASYDLEPGILTQCELLIPEGVEVLHATVDDVPALWQYVDAATATLELGAERLPQRVSLLFMGHASTLATAERSLTLAAPRLRRLEPRTTLWSVRGPVSQDDASPLLDHTIIDADAARRLRVGILQEVLDFDIGPTPQHRAHDLQRWRERWQQRMGDVTTNPVDSSAAPPVPIISLRDAVKWQQGPYEQDAWTYCAIDGAAPALTIIRRGHDVAGFVMRIAIALAICVLAWLGWKLSRSESVRDAFSRWPYLPGVVIGLVWWLWLSPSAFGWLIAAVFIAASLRPAWRPRTTRAVR